MCSLTVWQCFLSPCCVRYVMLRRRLWKSVQFEALDICTTKQHVLLIQHLHTKIQDIAFLTSSITYLNKQTKTVHFHAVQYFLVKNERTYFAPEFFSRQPSFHVILSVGRSSKLLTRHIKNSIKQSNTNRWSVRQTGCCFTSFTVARWRSSKVSALWLRGRGFESHQDRFRVITLSKLFTLMVLRPTQPSIPPG